MSAPVLFVVAGPNGAGKSTLVTRVLQPRTHLPFVNADVIAAQRWPSAQVEQAYAAAQVAEAARQQLLQAGESFITETVFSHRSKVDLTAAASDRGYLVFLHVVMVPVAVTLERVRHRVRHGGHDVPEQKVRDRYDRLWPLIAEAREIADRTTFYDNENDRKPFRVVGVYEQGRLVGEARWPEWTPPALVA